MALDVLKKGESVNLKQAHIQFHLALILLKLGKNQEALKHAKTAYKLGKPPIKLKNRLIKLGIWTDD